ncbi:hypothetical protein QAD02_013446 [Eretmocerus hayati]|uniref:Uncharacterized protein n=1 Tax=Eretmocerus hayati TaxID=131215 RepID=A0ACC2P543_9HYME|nr:hypothetical protein QAD02_013446 [Eretmocerus hayati]
MLPYYHASGHNFYAKSLHLYLQRMLALEDTMNPEEQNKFFEQGYCTIRRSRKFRSGIWPDLTIEQILIRAMKSAGELTYGRGTDESNVTKWITTTLALIDVCTAVEEFCGVSYSSGDQHQSLEHSQISRFAGSSELMRQFFATYHPFPVTGDIRSIYSGIVGDPPIINCHKALEVGTESLKSIIGKTFGDVKFERKRRVLPLSAVTSSVKIDGRTVPIKPLLILQRITLNIRQSSDIKKYLHTEMAPSPLSLFSENGMLKTVKAAHFTAGAFEP